MANLIPDTPGETPNYWCTWGLQNYIFGQGDPEFKLSELDGSRGAIHARNNLNEARIVGHNGWAGQIFDDIRQDLYLVLDDGWDLPLLPVPSSRKAVVSTTADRLEAARLALKMRNSLSSFYLHDDRFPNATGKPKERLKHLNDKVRQFGWKGLGVWIAAQEASNFTSKFDFRKKRYWRERAEWSKFAGIDYWKVDWGIKAWSKRFRKMLTDLGRKYHPGLLIEHAGPTGPFNSKAKTGLSSKNFIQNALSLLKFSDVYRIYDVSPFLSVPTTLDRVARILLNPQTQGTGKQLIHCEDEVYIAAALGCVMGIMRHPYKDLRVVGGKDIDFGMTSPRMCKARIDEVIRAVRWQRIAPAFRADAVRTEISHQFLFDEWHFEPGQFWDTSVTDKTIKQGAPATVARGLGCPQVKIDGDKPFVIASRNPNGALSVASIGRTNKNGVYSNPKADVIVCSKFEVDYIGIFGCFNSLEIIFPILPATTEVWAQDLKGNSAVDITHRIDIGEKSLRILGNLIDEVGLSAATPGDNSEPGLVIRLKK